MNPEELAISKMESVEGSTGQILRVKFEAHFYMRSYFQNYYGNITWYEYVLVGKSEVTQPVGIERAVILENAYLEMLG